MLSKVKNRALITLISMITLIFFNGCTVLHPRSRLKKITSVPITIEGVEFKVGDSKLGDIVNGGLLISPDANFENGIDGLSLEKMSYGFAYINNDKNDSGKVSFVNNTADNKNYSDCIINEYNIEFKNKEDNYNSIQIDGVNFYGMSIDDVKNAMSKKTNEVSEISSPDGSLAVLDYKVGKVSIDVAFENEDKTASSVDVKVYNIRDKVKGSGH